MKRMRLFGLAGIATIAIGLSGSTVQAEEYFGYNVAQNDVAVQQMLATASMGQVPPGCMNVPPSSCLIEQIGCHLTPCPYVPWTCFNLPPGATTTVCKVYCDQRPTYTPITLTVVKNVYVPIYIGNNPPPTVQPVDLDVKYREIHYLADEFGNPIDKNGNPLPKNIPAPGTYQGTGPQGAAPSPQTKLGSTATQPQVASAPTPTPAAPAAPEVAAPATPAKQWVYLPYEKAYGYGYQRADGYWIIDEGSRRATAPTASAAPAPAPLVTASTK